MSDIAKTLVNTAHERQVTQLVLVSRHVAIGRNSCAAPSSIVYCG